MAEQYPNEQWRPVVGYEGRYEVSDFGRVKRILSLNTKSNSGYVMSSFSRSGVWQSQTVHRVVAAAFIGPCPPGLQVNHKNGIKNDNRADNLEYVTPKENIRHASEMLGVKNNRNAKLTKLKVQKIRYRYTLGGITQEELAAEYGVTQSAIGQAVRRLTWAHVA